ncbi:SDR family NAD(P)-dependent oxidoreductase [Rhodococcus jostii]|uniref:SDR family NAD(P)-dependent oxidoreductase n=1 Tax=Rhodococcus jostii TaxID=132919 RepID=UPI003634A9CF
MSSVDVADATVFIVGGDSGIGLSVAHHFVRVGTQRIGLIGRNAEKVEAAARKLFESASGIWALSAVGDLSSPTDAHRLVAELTASLGDADILVNCLRDADAVSDAVAESMRRQGSGIVINVADVAEGPSC